MIFILFECISYLYFEYISLLLFFIRFICCSCRRPQEAGARSPYSKHDMYVYVYYNYITYFLKLYIYIYIYCLVNICIYVLFICIMSYIYNKTEIKKKYK